MTATVRPDLASGARITNTATIATTSNEHPTWRANNTSQVETAIEVVLIPVSGIVFQDVNGDGVRQTPGGGVEPPLPGVLITATDQQGNIVATAVTDSDGLWVVNLPPGYYTIQAPSLPSLVLSTDGQVSANVIDGPVSGLGFGYAAPTGLEIEYVRATWTNTGVRVGWAPRWETPQLVGFNVHRSDNVGSHGQRLNPQVIAPAAPPGEGAEYAWLDATASSGSSLYYWLQVMTAQGDVWIGPLQPAPATRVYLPRIVR